MARSIVPPPGHPDDPHGREPAARPETVHPAYDASLDPETRVLHAVPPSRRPAGSGSPIGPRPGPYGHSIIPRRRRQQAGRTVMAALGGGAAALLVLAVIGATLSTTDASRQGSTDAGAAPISEQDGADGSPPFAAVPYVLEVLNESGNDVAVTYSNGSGGISTSEVRSGWSIEVRGLPGEDTVFTASAGVDGAVSQQGDAVTCRVRQDGEIVRTSTATGERADCSGF